MSRDRRLSTALHALLHLAAHDTPVTSEVLASCLRTNPVVVRRTLAGLREAGLVRSQKGRGGGWSVACDLATTSLLDVHAAVGSPALLAPGAPHDEPACLVERAVHAALEPALRDAEAQLLARFGSIPLSRIAEDIARQRCLRANPIGPPHP